MDNVNVLIKHEILAHSQGWLLIMDYGVIGSTRDFGSLSTGSSPVGPTIVEYRIMAVREILALKVPVRSGVLQLK